MYRYHAKNRIDINGRTYNPGEIIISPIKIDELEEIGVKNIIRNLREKVVYNKQPKKIIKGEHMILKAR